MKTCLLNHFPTHTTKQVPNPDTASMNVNKNSVFAVRGFNTTLDMVPQTVVNSDATWGFDCRSIFQSNMKINVSFMQVTYIFICAPSGSSDFLLNVESSSQQKTHFPEIMIFTGQITILIKIYTHTVNDTDFITQPPAVCVLLFNAVYFLSSFIHLMMPCTAHIICHIINRRV